MALYFFAMYTLGGALGPLVTGVISDFFTGRAARAAGVLETAAQALEPFRAAGLHSAMYVIPGLTLVLVAVMAMASRTVARDISALQAWSASVGARRADHVWLPPVTKGRSASPHA